jgi:hypothetical protein
LNRVVANGRDAARSGAKVISRLHSRIRAPEYLIGGGRALVRRRRAAAIENEKAGCDDHHGTEKEEQHFASHAYSTALHRKKFHCAPEECGCQIHHNDMLT